MNWYWIKTNTFVKRFFFNQIWDIPNSEKKIYLTFDDGPTPEITEWVLSVLKTHEIKATFFCIGDNIRKHPEIFRAILSEGHSIGNHTYNHLQGWKTSVNSYINNVNSCRDAILKEADPLQLPLLFRPPYGKIRLSQSSKLRKLGYRIIMWDVLSADFDTHISKEKCLNNVTKNTTQGSIIVFHDSRKAFKNLEFALPKAIALLKEKGFQFEKIA